MIIYMSNLLWNIQKGIIVWSLWLWLLLISWLTSSSRSLLSLDVWGNHNLATQWHSLHLPLGLDYCSLQFTLNWIECGGPMVTFLFTLLTTVFCSTVVTKNTVHSVFLTCVFSSSHKPAALIHSQCVIHSVRREFTTDFLTKLSSRFSSC